MFRIYQPKYGEGIVIEHLISGSGYKVVTEEGICYRLYMIDGNNVEEYGQYDNLIVALACGRALLDDLSA